MKNRKKEEISVKDAITELRSASGLSRNHFSRELDLTTVSVFRYESGDLSPSTTILFKLARMALSSKETEHLAPVFIRPIAEALKMPERSISLAIRDAMKG